MMGRQTGDQSQLFYLFNLEERISGPICGRRINPAVTRICAIEGRSDADASRFHSKAPDEIDWSARCQNQRRLCVYHRKTHRQRRARRRRFFFFGGHGTRSRNLDSECSSLRPRHPRRLW